MELGLENLGNQASFATLDEIQPHHITRKSRVILEGRALMSSQFICSAERLDSAHIIHETLLQNIHDKMQPVKGLTDCGATSIFLSLSLLRKLELPHKPAFTHTFDNTSLRLVLPSFSPRRAKWGFTLASSRL